MENGDIEELEVIRFIAAIKDIKVLPQGENESSIIDAPEIVKTNCEKFTGCTLEELATHIKDFGLYYIPQFDQVITKEILEEFSQKIVKLEPEKAHSLGLKTRKLIEWHLRENRINKHLCEELDREMQDE